MKPKIIALILCGAIVLSAAACGASGGSNSASSEPVEESEAEMEADFADSTNETDEALPTDSTGQNSETEKALPTDSANEAVKEEAAAKEAGPGGGAMTYAYATAQNEGDKLIVVPNGTVSDSTVLYNDKMLGGLCDYVDSKVLEDGRTINREFLYDLISVQVIDPQLYPDYDSFSRVMCMCLTMANEFNSIDVRVKDLVLDSNENTKQVFEVTAEGKDTSWILDGHTYQFYLNDGNTEYTSSMFDAETLAVWSFVLDEYFGVEK